MPRPFSQTVLKLKIVSNDMIDDIIDDLNKGNKNASMSLARSLKSNVLDTGASIISVRFKAKSHWRFVDEGRKPGKYAPIAPLQRWARVKLGLSEKEAEGAAYAISKTIKKKGIKPTNIFTDNVNKFKKTALNVVAKSGKQDVTAEIRKILNRK